MNRAKKLASDTIEFVAEYHRPIIMVTAFVGTSVAMRYIARKQFEQMAKDIEFIITIAEESVAE